MFRTLIPLHFVLLVISITAGRAAGELVAADVAPSDAIYFMRVADPGSFYSDFFKYSQVTTQNPVVAQTIKNGAPNSLLSFGPDAPQTPLALDAVKLAFLAVQKELFLACLAEGEAGQTAFLGGGIASDPEVSQQKLKEAISAKIPIPWGSLTLDGLTVESLSIPEVGTFYLCAKKSWLLFGTSLTALKQALSTIDQPGSGLSSNQVWKSTMEGVSDKLVIYYSNIQGVAALIEKQKNTAVTSLLTGRLKGLRAFAWTFETAGPGGVAIDLFHINFSPESIAGFQAAFPPLGRGWRSLAGANSVVLAALKADLPKVKALPEFQGLQVSASLEQVSTALQSAASPIHAAILVDQNPESLQPHRAMLARGDEESTAAALDQNPSARAPIQKGQNGNSYQFTGSSYFLGYGSGAWWIVESTETLEYFRSRPASSTQDLLTKTDALPGVENAFLELRMDREKTASAALTRLSKNYPAWYPILTKRGVALPENPPVFDAGSYVGPLRSTMGFAGENLILMNSFQLGSKTGSTLLTASADVIQVAFHDEMTSARQLLHNAFSPFTAVPEANIFDTCIWTNFLLGPLLPPGQNSVCVDLISQFLLATESP